MDQVDLEAVTIPFPLVLTCCAIYCGVNLRFVETRLLSFQGSSIRHRDGIALRADEASMNGSVLLRQGFQTEGAVSLISATITGDLDCTGGIFLNGREVALNAGGAHVDGRALLRQDFHAEGEVSLLAPRSPAF
jgi:hypothetical protein